MASPYSTTEYRYPSEYLILGITILVVLMVIALTAAATVCGSAIFVIAILILGYLSSRNSHQALIAEAKQVTPLSAPDLIPLIEESSTRLQVEPVNIFIVPSRQLNAYTFGMESPRAIVLYSSIFKIMDRDEIQFVLGHEMGHIKLGHTSLNTLVGGLAGIPSTLGAAAIMALAFRWWNRACEYSADRAGILACGNPEKAISALVKFEVGPAALTRSGLQTAMQHLESDDEDIMHNLEEVVASHPMIAKRINEIRSFSKSSSYLQIQSLVNKNLSI